MNDETGNKSCVWAVVSCFLLFTIGKAPSYFEFDVSTQINFFITILNCEACLVIFVSVANNTDISWYSIQK